MTRDFANELLYLWKVGAEIYPAHVITRALYVTGDLDGPHLEADARLVSVPCVPAWVEGAGMALSKATSERPSLGVLATAGTVDRGNAKERR